MNLADLLRESADRHPDRPALTDVASGASRTYAEVLAAADSVAAALRTAGVTPAQRIALVGGNSLAYVGVAFGILAAGGCLVPIASNLRDAEREQILRGIDVNGVIRVPEDGAPWRFLWRDREQSAPAGFAAVDPAFVRFSSGTTADAKGVVLSHATTLARVAAADAVLRFTPDDRVLWVLPLAYHFAVTIPAYLRAGAHILLCPESQPAKMAAALAAERATVLYAAPLQLERLTALADATPLPALRMALSTAAPLRPETATHFEARFGRPLGQAYGIIEAGLPCIDARDDPAIPAGSVGRPVPGYEVAVFADDGRRLGAGASGEVGIRGPGLFDAYYAPWTPRAATLRDGWFMPGDVGTLDASGALTLQGRRKSTIVVAGLKFFPEEVEAVLATCPGIVEARVFAHPHPKLGELPHAEVVLEPGAAFDRDAIAQHCARELSPYKVPVEISAVASIAKTAGGKILRR
ncbi:MAG: AMP-binding protein [Candidatus Binatia bacterium]